MLIVVEPSDLERLAKSYASKLLNRNDMVASSTEIQTDADGELTGIAVQFKPVRPDAPLDADA